MIDIRLSGGAVAIALMSASGALHGLRPRTVSSPSYGVEIAT
ncbi:MAG: hypothetical protein ABR524_12565 [Thermoanaerobaculia bacterium]